MERFTISMDENLAAQFDRLIQRRGYKSRSEAVRDLVRSQLEQARREEDLHGHCVANLSYVYNHHQRELGERLTGLQHDHHDLTVAAMHAHLDHDNCLESVVLRGPAAAVRDFAAALTAERGVRHGQLNIVSVDFSGGDDHHHHNRGDAAAQDEAHAAAHVHMRPKN